MIRYLGHAIEAIERRGLARFWVEAPLDASDWSEADLRRPERTRSYKVISEAGDRVLRVVHWREGDDIVVLRHSP